MSKGTKDILLERIREGAGLSLRERIILTAYLSGAHLRSIEIAQLLFRQFHQARRAFVTFAHRDDGLDFQRLRSGAFAVGEGM